MKVILQPQNGYINRIQALASAGLLARELGAEFEVEWIPDQFAPARPEEVFSSGFLKGFTLLSECKPWNLDPYLKVSFDKTTVTLAGLDRGEQEFMNALRTELSSNSKVQELRISAGGKFSLNGTGTEFDRNRGSFYRNEVQFTLEIEQAAEQIALDRGDYIGLHLRYSDRSHQAPSRRSIESALRHFTIERGVDQVFIASDDFRALDHWIPRLKKLGLHAWSASPPASNTYRAAAPALIDWRLLTLSKGVVFFQESSFGEESAVAVAGGPHGIGLPGSHWNHVQSLAGEYLRAMYTYPSRHFSYRKS